MGTTDKRETLDTTIEPTTGMQREYLVLSEDERRRGFVRPVRQTYVHAGNGGPKRRTRALTDEERERYSGAGFVFFEVYPDGSGAVGRFWTQEQVDATTRCGTQTTMGLAIAQTYARDPGFYGSTFCAHCRAHFPVGADGEFVWDGTTEKVGT